MIDMLSLMGLTNKDRFVRQLSTILIVESGKMKKLLVNNDYY